MSWKEHILMLKCGVLVGDKQVGDFKCISWYYGPPTPYVRQQSKGSVTFQTLRERLKTIFVDNGQPFQVAFIDEHDDKIILPIDDVKESVIALQCFGYLSSLPIKIFIQYPDKKTPSKDLLRQEENKALVPRYEDSGLKIVDTLNKLEKTIHTLGERIVVLLEDRGKSSAMDAKRAENDNKSADKASHEEPVNMAASQESATIKASGPNSRTKLLASSVLEMATKLGIFSYSDAESYSSRHQSSHVRSPSESSTSSSSFSVQSHSGEDDWTQVHGGMNIDGRRRRFTTGSSCASHQSDNSQDGVVHSMEDEMSSVMFDMLCRSP